jgi:hypothetical protein
MANFIDGVIFQATQNGTGSFIVAAPVQGFMTPFQAHAIEGATYHYRAENKDLSEWEIGSGVYLSGALTRATVLYNNFGSSSRINFSKPPIVGLVPLGADFLDLIGGGGSNVTISEDPPSSPSEGDFWLEESTLILYIWYDDGSSAQWVSVNNVPGPPGAPGLPGPPGTGTTIDYESALLASAAVVPAAQKMLRTGGYMVAGDGGAALYAKVGSPPSHNGKFQSADGAWWELAETSPNELMFGAVASSTNAVQTTAIQWLFDFCAAKHRKATIVSYHAITATLNVPANVVVEFGYGFSDPNALLDKVFNGDMMTINYGVMLIRPQLRGNGGTYSGRGIVVASGDYQTINDAFIFDTAGPALEFPTGSVGVQFKSLNSFYSRHTATDPAIVGPVTEPTTTGYRYFFNPGAGGGMLFRFNNGNMWTIEGGSSGGLDFSGTTTGRVKILGHRCAAPLTVYGVEHIISDCAIAGTFTLGAGATYCSIHDNIVAGGVEIIDSSGNGTNQITHNSVSFTPVLRADTTNPNIGSTGFVQGSYSRRGKLLTINYRFVFAGTGVSGGSGPLYASLPLNGVTAAAFSTGAVYGFDGGTAMLAGVAIIQSGEFKIYFLSHNGIAYWNGTSQPWAGGLAAGDDFGFSITVPIQ